MGAKMPGVEKNVSEETGLHPSHTGAGGGFGIWPRDFVPLNQQPAHRQEFFERILEQFNSTDALTILDIGCGNGKSIIPAIETLSHHFEVTAILSDLTPQATQATRSAINALNTSVEYLVCQMSGSQLGLPPSSVDAITCVNVFHWLSKQQQLQLLEEVRKILRPRGLLMIDTVTPYNPGIVGRMTSSEFGDYKRKTLGIQDCLTPPLATHFPYTYKGMPWYVHDLNSLHALLHGSFTIIEADTYDNPHYKHYKDKIGLFGEHVPYYYPNGALATHYISQRGNCYIIAERP